MSWEQMQSVFQNCLEMCNKYKRLPYFYLTGGDPILHADFGKLLNLFKENGAPFTISGNPIHLKDELCRKLKDMGCEKYQMSLDGMEKTHDWFRKPGSFNCTLAKIQYMATTVKHRHSAWHSGKEKMMKAVTLTQPIKGSEIRLSKCEIPKVKSSWVLVRIKAFGINHSEQILRKYEISAPYIQKTIIPGIECVGLMSLCLTTAFLAGMFPALQWYWN